MEASVADFDRGRRGHSYGHALDAFPGVRSRELRAALSAVRPVASETILDVGAGTGALTQLLQDKEPRAKIVAVDISSVMCEILRRRVDDVEVRLMADELSLPMERDSCDAIVSLANFHHVPDKPSMFLEFARCLKQGGRLIIVDVAAGTAVQRYFDNVVDKICSTGHRHSYLDEEAARALSGEVGMSLRSWDIRDVPWQFKVPQGEDTPVRDYAGEYLRMLHDATCDSSVCYRLAESYLGFEIVAADELVLNWSLGFLQATKR